MLKFIRELIFYFICSLYVFTFAYLWRVCLLHAACISVVRQMSAHEDSLTLACLLMLLVRALADAMVLVLFESREAELRDVVEISVLRCCLHRLRNHITAAMPIVVVVRLASCVAA